MSYLLDTCIISKLRKIKKHPDKKLETWIIKHPDTSYFISVLTVGEIQLGISKLDHQNSSENPKRVIVEDWLLEDLVPRFADRILDVDIDVALAWGKVVGDCQKRGVTIPSIDGLIAATALVHNLTVVTENVNHFVETGVRLLNPWCI